MSNVFTSHLRCIPTCKFVANTDDIDISRKRRKQTFCVLVWYLNAGARLILQTPTYVPTTDRNRFKSRDSKIIL